MKKLFYSATSIILSAILVAGCLFTALAEADFDMDLGEYVDCGDIVFVNQSGEKIAATDEFCNVIFNGERVVGQPATLTVEYGDGTNAYEFLGWYDGDTCISKNEVLEYTYGDYGDISPVILSKNVLTHGGSFESITKEGSVRVEITDTESYYYKNGENYFLVKEGPAPTGNLWGIYSNFAYPQYEKIGEEYVAIENPVAGAYCGDSWGYVNAVTGDYSHTYYSDYDNDPTAKETVIVKPHSGNTMLATNSYWRHNIKELTGLKKNTDYVLSVWIYTQNDTSCLSWSAVTSNYDGLKTGASAAHLDSCEVLGLAGFTANYGEWTQLKIPFNSGENEVAYFHIGNTIGKISGGKEGMNFIDDLTVCEADAVGFVGTKELIETETITASGAVEYNDFNAELNFSGASLKFSANCKGTVKLNYTAIPNAGYSLRFKILVDGAEKEDYILKDVLSGSIILATDLPEGEHTFEIVRATENYMGKVIITEISFDGEYLAPPEKEKLSFDFYGDSLTAGYGTTYFSLDDVSDWSYYEDGTKSYAYLTSKALNASPNIFAYSGIGIAVGSDPDGGGSTILDIYPNVPKNTKSDIVVIYLGTNDIGKYKNLGLTLDDVITIFSDFIKTVRTDYTKAKIVMLHYSKTESIILPAVEQAKTDGVTELYTLEVPCGTSGAVSHPNIEEQAETAAVVTEYLSTLVSEEMSVPAELKGNSIRAVGNQGLRFKYKIDTDIINNGYMGYTVKEIGALAIRTDYLNGAELVKNGEYTYNKLRLPVAGIFYNAENNVNMINDEGIVSALLFNIGYNKTNKTTTYEAYKYLFTVRTYMILESDGEEITVYGDHDDAAVFNVMKTILNSDKTDDQTLSDKNAVKTLLNLPTEDATGITIQDAYDAWISSKETAN